MPTPGQPTLYKPEYRELAHNDCLLGAANQVFGQLLPHHPPLRHAAA